MALPVVYRRKLGRDLAGGFAYDEGQTGGLGGKLLAAVDFAFDAIERYPEMFARVHGEVRSAIVSRFPYAVFYRVDPSASSYSPCRIRLVIQDSGRNRDGLHANSTKQPYLRKDETAMV